MRSLIRLLALSLFCTTGATLHAAKLTVELTGLRNTEGSLFIFLWTPEDEGYPKPKEGSKLPYRYSPATTPQVTFEDIAPGQYAVSAIHYEPGGEAVPPPPKFGIPKEGVGLSNNPKVGFFNRPTFEKSAFDLNEDTTLHIEVRYYR